MAIIYKIINTVNNKVYIGKSKYNKPEYYGSGLKISSAILKYGKDSFTKHILEEGDIININEREMYWIAQYNATVDEFGYNISKGGDGGDHYWAGLSVEDRIKHNKKISRSKAGKSQGPHTPNTRKKMSDNFNRDPKLIEQRAASRRKVYTCVNHTTLEIFVTYNLKEFCSTNKLSYGLIQGNARQRKSLCYGIWSCSEGDLVDQGLVLIQSIEVDITKSLQLIREKLRTKNNQGENNPMWGKKHSDATKDKMRLSKIKKSSNINE